MKADCSKCKYAWMVPASNKRRRWYACDYIGHTGKRRPCKPGPECEVFEEQKGQRINVDAWFTKV